MPTIPETVLLSFPRCVWVTLDELEADFGMPRREISNAIGRLVALGQVERAQVGSYRLTDAGLTARGEGAQRPSIPETVLQGIPRGVCITLDALEAKFEISRREISNAVGRLIVRGLIERAQAGCYQLTDLGLQAKMEGFDSKRECASEIVPQVDIAPDTFCQRLWLAMRMSTSFTIGELVTAASWPIRNAEMQARQYLRRLKAAAYVVELPVRQRSTRAGSFKRFRLIRDTGPIAPVYRSGRNAMCDFNLRKEVSCDSPT